MSVYRVNKNENYTMMSNYHFHDKRLSLKAKGLLSEILSLSDSWNYSLAGLASINKESEKAVKNALDELKECGYVVVTKLYPEKNVRESIEYVYDIYEQPQQPPQNVGLQDVSLQDVSLQDVNLQDVNLQDVELQKGGQLNTNNKSINNKITNNKTTNNKEEKENNKEKDYAVVDEGLSRVIRLYERIISNFPTSRATELLKGYTEELGADVVCHAIEIAADNNVRKWAYIEKILQDYSHNHFTTLEQVKLNEQLREEERRRMQSGNAGRNYSSNGGTVQPKKDFSQYNLNDDLF